jgi:hypothetical protein
LEVWLLAGVWLGVIIMGMVDHYWWTSQQAFLAMWGMGGGTVLMHRKGRAGQVEDDYKVN